MWPYIFFPTNINLHIGCIVDTVPQNFKLNALVSEHLKVQLHGESIRWNTQKSSRGNVKYRLYVW